MIRASAWAMLIGALIAGLVCGLLVWREDNAPGLVLHEPRGIMGTDCRLAAIVGGGERQLAGDALQAAEAQLRRVESHASSWIEASDVGRLNAADDDAQVAVEALVRDIIAIAGAAHAASDGAFDIACKPQLLLWREAAAAGELPDEGAIVAARESSRMGDFSLGEEGVHKARGSARIDLGGIAKGYAIDRALGALQAAGLDNALVDVGGDIRCIGDYDGAGWPVQVRSPWREDGLLRLRLHDRAVCTSGDYARYAEIDGRRFSHIVDPRSGWALERSPAVTVIAADCTTADVWATALSVLGEQGLQRLPDGVEALLVFPAEDGPRLVETPGFAAYAERSLPGEPQSQ